jgi:uncharacterized protein (TIGR04255 family)
MATPKHLPNAPLTEALIDFRVKGKTGFEVASFRNLKDRLASELPVVEERFLFEGSVEIRPGNYASQVAARGELNGFWFKSSDGLNIAQFRRDGFTFNRLKPYTSWKEVFPKAWELWQVYLQTGAAEFVTRVAVRYINRLTVPVSVGDLAVYLTAPPRLPEGISGDVASFLTRMVLNTDQQGLTANITQALEKDIDSKSLVIILDIDAYRQGEFDIGDTSIRTTFDSLHDLKNAIFFSSITDEAVTLCQ